MFPQVLPHSLARCEGAPLLRKGGTTLRGVSLFVLPKNFIQMCAAVDPKGGLSFSKK